ncbi:MAG: hypothetical protein FJ241_11415 [Nitrospira sp.]|nr:hypothetical protein [Nitrospira sp.]
MEIKRDFKRLNGSKRAQNSVHVLFLFIIFSVCCTLIIPGSLFADGISTPGSTIPPEQWEKEPPMKKPPLPSQLYNLKPSPDKVLHLPPIDVDKLIEEDRAAGKGRPLRDAVIREINVSPLTHGEWYEIGKGSIWLFEIHAPSAEGINIRFTDFYLPEGAKVYVYSPSSPDKYKGPYRIEGPNFGSDLVLGDRVIIELAIPIPFDHSKAPFIIKEIGHMYRPFGRKTTSERMNITPLAATCHNDATCYPEWATEGDAVGRLVFFESGLTAYCTGTIIDNFAQDRTPYFLTTNHCIPNDTLANTARVYWFYETSSCNGTPIR